MSQSPMAYTDKNEEDRNVLYAEIARLRADLEAAREAIRSLHKLLPSSFAKDALSLPAVRAAVEGGR